VLLENPAKPAPEQHVIVSQHYPNVIRHVDSSPRGIQPRP
jgi:hypothetical protein